MKLPRLGLVRTSFCCLALAGCLSSANAEVQTLTDKQGRSLKADVLSVENGKVKIKREDGQTFDLPLESLADADQRQLKAWAAANPPKLGPDAIQLQFSRVKVSTEKEEQSGGAVTAYKDQWGYNLTLANRTSRELGDVRAEYILFVKQDLGPGSKEKDPGFRRVKQMTKSDPIPIHGNVSFRTETVTSYRYVLAPGWVWSGSTNKPIRDTLHGMWLRIYVGNELIVEKITPEDLSKTEKW